MVGGCRHWHAPTFVKTDMKILRIIAVAFIATMVWSCSQKANKTTEELASTRVDTSMSRTTEDTLELTSLVDEYLMCIKERKYDVAASMISVYNDKTNTLEAPTDSIVNMLKAQYINFPVLSYRIDEMNLYSETDTEVRYTVTMFECNEREQMPNTIRFMLFPKRINGAWALCIEGRTEIKNN